MKFVPQMYHKICIVSLTLLLIHSKILLLIFRFATVAHLAEQHIRNVQVAGSIPASGSTKLRSQHRSFFMQGNIAGNISGSVKNVGVEDTPRISEPLSFFEKTLFSSAPTGVSHR